MPEDLMTYVIAGAVILGVVGMVVRIVLMSVGVSALKDFLKNKRR